MQLTIGVIFTDPRTNFIWQIEQPWVTIWHQRQVGWICKGVGTNPEQSSHSYWLELEIIEFLESAESTQMKGSQDNGIDRD